MCVGWEGGGGVEACWSTHVHICHHLDHQMCTGPSKRDGKWLTVAEQRLVCSTSSHK